MNKIIEELNNLETIETPEGLEEGRVKIIRAGYLIENLTKCMMAEHTTQDYFWEQAERTMITAIFAAAYEKYNKINMTKIANEIMVANIEKLDSFFNSMKDKEESLAYEMWKKFMYDTRNHLTRCGVLRAVHNKFQPFVEI